MNDEMVDGLGQWCHRAGFAVARAFAYAPGMMPSSDRPMLQVRRLSLRATIPAYHSELAAGLDLAACLPEGTASIVIAPGRIAIVPIGIAVAIPAGFEGQVRPRSGLASKFAVTLPNAPGTIDADYRGEVMVPLINLGREPYTLEHGTRVAQMVIAPVSRVDVVEAETLDETSRGHGGFGSTGFAARPA